MKPQIKNQAIHDIEEQIARHESALVPLRADLEVLRTHPPEESTWRAHVSSAWSSEGEESWSGTFQAPDLRTAVYKVMLEFCKNAGRVYPGYKGSSTGHVYDSFDVQGRVYVYLQLPNGTLVSADRDRLARIKDQFNRKAPEPSKMIPEPKPVPSGIT